MLPVYLSRFRFPSSASMLSLARVQPAASDKKFCCGDATFRAVPAVQQQAEASTPPPLHLCSATKLRAASVSGPELVPSQ
jgi:hypothetical protein